jgi:uncharacterized protein (DUF2147 family)
MKRISIAVLAVVGLMLFAIAPVLGQSAANDPILGYWFSLDEETGEPNAAWLIERDSQGKAIGRTVYFYDDAQDILATELDRTYSGIPLGGDLRTQQLRTVPLIYGLDWRERGRWSGGHIIDPRDGKRYGCELILHQPDSRRAVNGQITLEIKGKVLFFSQSEYWVRGSVSAIPAEYRR